MARWHSRQSMTLPITAAFSVVSLKIERAVPRDNPSTPPPAPGGKKKRPNTTGKRLWSVLKILVDGSLSLKEPAPPPPNNNNKKTKYHASFIPIAYLHLGQQTLLTESRKQI